MLPDPLHPALVHFPIVLALLAPLVAAGFFWAILTFRLPARAWIAVIVLQAVVFGSAWITAETGEDEEERVERVISEDPIEEHEEAAEWFIWIAAITLPVAGAGIFTGSLGTSARALALAGTVLAAVAVARVGHTGGELVYKHGAALAYLDGDAAADALGRLAAKKLFSDIADAIEASDAEEAEGTDNSRRRRRGQGD